MLNSLRGNAAVGFHSPQVKTAVDQNTALTMPTKDPEIAHLVSPRAPQFWPDNLSHVKFDSYLLISRDTNYP